MKGFVSENRNYFYAGGAALAPFAAYKMFGGSSDEKSDSKWFSSLTDWKVLVPAIAILGVLGYKYGPDGFKNLTSETWEKIKSFLSSDKPSTIDAAGIKSLGAGLLAWHNKKASASERRSTFPEKLIKSKCMLLAHLFG